MSDLHSQTADRSTITLMWQLFKLSWTHYVRDNPPQVSIWTIGVRGLLQIAFFCLLTSHVAGWSTSRGILTGIAFSAVGVCSTVAAGTAVTDKAEGTFWRARLSPLPTSLIIFVRSLPFMLVAPVFLTVYVGVAHVFVRSPLSTWGFLSTLALCSGLSVFSIFITAFIAHATVAHRADVIAPNIIQYALLICGGILVTESKPHWLALVESVFPTTYIADALFSSTPMASLAAQMKPIATTGCLWMVLCVSAVEITARRAAATGQDSFAE